VIGVPTNTFILRDGGISRNIIGVVTSALFLARLEGASNDIKKSP